MPDNNVNVTSGTLLGISSSGPITISFTMNNAPPRLIATIPAESDELVRGDATDSEWDLVQLAHSMKVKCDNLLGLIKNIRDANIYQAPESRAQIIEELCADALQ